MDKSLHFKEFAPLTASEWREKIIAETGVTNIDELTTGSQLKIHPLHTEQQMATLPVQTRDAWTIVHPHGRIGDEKSSNASILHALVGGANGVYLVVDEDVDWQTLLKDIELNYISLFIFSTKVAATESLEAYIAKQYPNHHPSVFYTRNGAPKSTANSGARVSGIDLHHALDVAPSVLLGLAIAECHELLQNTNPEDIWYALPTSGHYFTNIIQLRALHQLHHFLLENNELPKADPFVFVRSNLQNKSADDVYDNMIRNTAEGMGAVVGGAHALCLEPHNAASGKPDAFGYRVARNAQLIFQYEAHLNAQLDPASGSYFFENQTRELANEAWEIFRAIEAKGGYADMVKRGDITTFIETHCNT